MADDKEVCVSAVPEEDMVTMTGDEAQQESAVSTRDVSMSDMNTNTMNASAMNTSTMNDMMEKLMEILNNNTKQTNDKFDMIYDHIKQTNENFDKMNNNNKQINDNIKEMNDKFDNNSKEMNDKFDNNSKEMNEKFENMAGDTAKQISNLKDNMCETRDMLLRSMADVYTNARQYTNEQCEALKEEVKEEIKGSCKAMKEEMEEIKDSCETMRADIDEKFERLHRTVQEQAVTLARVTTGPSQQANGGSAKVKEETQAEVLTDERACEVSLHPPSCSPRHHLALKPSPLDHSIAPGSPSGNSYSPVAPSRPRKPSEFDGKVQWEAYFAQFQLLADTQGWDEAESALQLVASLRGAALEVLGHLTSTQRSDYSSIVEALRRKFGNYQQAEVYRARLKGRVRTKGEALPQLAQDIDTLVRRAFPTASEDMVGVLTTDHFTDALQNRELQLYVKQAHPKDMKEALARALEYEAFTRTSVGGWSVSSSPITFPTRTFQARRAQTSEFSSPPSKKKKQQPPSPSGRSSPVAFRGYCYGCGRQGHRQSQCRRERRTRSLERPALATNAFQPCCKSCGQYGHFSIACKNPKEVGQAGNEASLAAGATSQPAMGGPLAF